MVTSQERLSVFTTTTSLGKSLSSLVPCSESRSCGLATVVLQVGFHLPSGITLLRLLSGRRNGPRGSKCWKPTKEDERSPTSRPNDRCYFRAGLSPLPFWAPIVHCDLKPGNFLDSYLSAHLCDFGLAKLFFETNENNLSKVLTNSAAIKVPSDKLNHTKVSFIYHFFISLGLKFYGFLVGDGR